VNSASDNRTPAADRREEHVHPPTGNSDTESQTGSEGLRVFAHPLRLRIMSLLTGTAMSAAEVARELGTTQANASYHLRRLHGAGLLDVAEEIQIRGGLARRYRHQPASGERIRTGKPDDHRLLAAALAAELQRRTAFRVPGTTAPMTDAELWVDPETWQEIRDSVTEAMHRLHDVAQPPRTAGTVRVSATVSLFQMADGT
jgi:DNA-binding transcriptional ArsR family regulator